MYGLDCKFSRIFTDANIYTAFVIGDIIYSVWNCSSAFRKRKIMIKNLKRCLFRQVFTTAILEITNGKFIKVLIIMCIKKCINDPVALLA